MSLRIVALLETLGSTAPTRHNASTPQTNKGHPRSGRPLHTRTILGVGQAARRAVDQVVVRQVFLRGVFLRFHDQFRRVAFLVAAVFFAVVLAFLRVAVRFAEVRAFFLTLARFQAVRVALRRVVLLAQARLVVLVVFLRAALRVVRLVAVRLVVFLRFVIETVSVCECARELVPGLV